MRSERVGERKDIHNKLCLKNSTKNIVEESSLFIYNINCTGIEIAMD